MKSSLCVVLGVLLFNSSLFAAPPKIGVLLKDRDLFWSAAEKGALAAGNMGGAELIVKAPVAPNSLPQQLALLNALLKEPLDALVIAPLTTDDFQQPLAALAAKGTKIIALDTKLPEGMASTYIGYNQAAMAEAAARHLAGLMQDGDEAALMRASSIEGMSIREKTLLATFKTLRPKNTLFNDVTSGSEKQDDLQKCTLLLERHPGIKAVCTPFSASSMAMIRALQEKGLAGKILHVGFGSGLPDSVVQAIESGAMHGWIAQQPKLIGSKGVEAAIDLVKGKPVPTTIDVPYFIVTKANLHEPQIQAMRN